MKIFQIPGHARSWMYLMRMIAHCKITRVGSIEHVKYIQQLAISWILYTEFLGYHLSNERALALQQRGMKYCLNALKERERNNNDLFFKTKHYVRCFIELYTIKQINS